MGYLSNSRTRNRRACEDTSCVASGGSARGDDVRAGAAAGPRFGRHGEAGDQSIPHTRRGGGESRRFKAGLCGGDDEGAGGGGVVVGAVVAGHCSCAGASRFAAGPHSAARIEQPDLCPTGPPAEHVCNPPWTDDVQPSPPTKPPELTLTRRPAGDCRESCAHRHSARAPRTHRASRPRRGDDLRTPYRTIRALERLSHGRGADRLTSHYKSPNRPEARAPLSVADLGDTRSAWFATRHRWPLGKLRARVVACPRGPNRVSPALACFQVDGTLWR